MEVPPKEVNWFVWEAAAVVAVALPCSDGPEVRTHCHGLASPAQNYCQELAQVVVLNRPADVKVLGMSPANQQICRQKVTKQAQVPVCRRVL